MKLYHAVSLSILVHLVLILGLMVAGYEFRFEKKEKAQWLQIVDTPDVIMSDETVRVKKETRTRETAPAEIAAFSKKDANIKQKSVPAVDAKSKGKKYDNLNPNSDDIFLKAGNQMSPAFRQQLQTFLPRDLEIGEVTALNSDQNLFYTFYRRMAEKVIWPWAQNVVNGFEKMKAMNQLGGSRKAWVTTIEVILDKNGTVVSTQPLQLAGDWDIDNAPVRAFKQAKNFPNPPVEMVEEDGYIRIRYRFTVYYNPL